MPRTIAIVDDDEAVRESLAALLSAAGYAVSAYASGAAFLTSVQGTGPDGLILDHQMLGITGVELAEHLGCRTLQTKIVMVSGNLTDGLRSRARRAGVTAILEKPFSDETLVATIEGELG